MSKFNKEESMVILLIECGHQDFNFTIEEEDYIKKAFGSKLYNNGLKRYQSMKSPEVDKVVLELLKSLSPPEIQTINEKVNGLFQVDGEFCRFEKKYFAYLNHISAQIHSE